MLKPDALQNIKLSVTSSGPGDKVEVKWGAKNEDGKLSDQTCRIEGSELVLPYVAWKASRRPRYLPISPHVSLCLPISPYISLCRPRPSISPHMSPYLPMSPYVSLYLPISPCVAWKASRGVTKSEHTLRVIATLLGSGSPRAANPNPNPHPNQVAPGPLP